MRKKFIQFALVQAVLVIVAWSCSDLTVNFSDGQALYHAKCSSCHNIIAPDRHNEQQWQFYVEKYGRKMTDKQKQTVMDYLLQDT